MHETPPKDDTLHEFGRRMAQRRRELGLSQTDLAERLGFSTPQVVSRYECGDQDPRLTTLLRLARALDMPLADLLAEEAPGGVETQPGDDRLIAEAVRAIGALRGHPDALRLAVASLRAMAAVGSGAASKDLA